ncbi:MAG: hypothetical protein R3C41_08990 [Calditrichia bacterium]
MNRFLGSIFWMLMAFMLFPLYAQNNLSKEVNLKKLPPSERFKINNDHEKALRKSLQDDSRHDRFKETIINGNEIRVLITNQGSISTPNADNSNADLVWPSGPNGLGYAYEFGPMIGAEVIDANGDTISVITDGFISFSDGDYEPGTANKWGWEPRLGFSDQASNEVATFTDLDRDLDGKPDSWPENWFNEALGRYVWPAFLGDDATTPDEEVFYVMDDFDNAEFEYYPVPSDSSVRGLGLELQVRMFQFNNPLAEDLIFLVYTITNVSEKTLNKVHLGMFGDPHIGGPNDFSDDNAGFISAFNEDPDLQNARNMLYAWDNNGIGDFGRRPGYFGYRFLESPGIDDDGQDNDGDELIDESPFNDAGTFIFGPIGEYGAPKEHWSGDEDGDWDPEFDDVGVDGIAGTGDFGEGDGKPNQRFYLDFNNNGILDPGEPTSESRLEGYRFGGGEPNFGFLDIAESDQLGLTSFNALLFGGNNRPRNDQLMWDLMSTQNQRPEDPEPVIEQEADNVFIYGSGPFTLRPGESQRFSIALLLGEDFSDLVQNASTSQQVFESDYRFAQAPRKPMLTAVPGDEKVTLYWDAGAEASFDPFVGRANPDDPSKGFDFEGYKIYRSQDESFNDTKTITDSKGNAFLSEPITYLKNGVELPAQFDIVNEYSGLSSIEYTGRGVRYDLGNNSGLTHSFVDSNGVKNGVTYFYAVVAFDRGDENAGVAPSETQRTIRRDAVDRQYTFDINTAAVVPGPPASGYMGPDLSNGMGDNLAAQIDGNATGTVAVNFLDPLLVENNVEYNVVFDTTRNEDDELEVLYSVIREEVKSVEFTSKDTLFVNLNLPYPIYPSSVELLNAGGSVVDPTQYELLYETTRIRSSSPNSLPEGQKFTLRYKSAPVYRSQSLAGEDDNTVFEGVRVVVEDRETALDSLTVDGGKSGFKIIQSNTNFSDELTTIGLADVGNAAPYPADFEIHFFDYDTTADGKFVSPGDTSIGTNVVAPFKVFEVETGRQVDIFINEPFTVIDNKRWDWFESIRLIRPGATNPTQTTYMVQFTVPADTFMAHDSTDSLVYRPIYPGEGDIFTFFSQKPFDAGDSYRFTTRAAEFSNEAAKNALQDVIVVPNPYIAFSETEIAGVSSGDRDDRNIQFRNLPRECTIRIYTITGEFVAQLDKNDNRDYISWNLLTFESQSLAYGVYIYHVDAPGVGTKIGRFAIIK